MHSGPGGADLRMFLKYSDETERRKYWETEIGKDVPGVVLNSFQFVQPPSLAIPRSFTTESRLVNMAAWPAPFFWFARASSAPMPCPSTTTAHRSH